MATPFECLSPGTINSKASGIAGLFSWDRSKRSRHRAAPRKTRGPKEAEAPQVLFEPLEQRFLLSADLSPLVVAMANKGNDITVLLDTSHDLVEVLNNQ